MLASFVHLLFVVIWTASRSEGASIGVQESTFQNHLLKRQFIYPLQSSSNQTLPLLGYPYSLNPSASQDIPTELIKPHKELAAKYDNVSLEAKTKALKESFEMIFASVYPKAVLGGKKKNCFVFSANWTCPAGYFCLTPGDYNEIINGGPASIQNKCPPGFMCPENTYQPRYCCPGVVCDTPGEPKLCPGGSYCPAGSVKPVSCLSFFGLTMGLCREGTEKAPKYGIVLVVICLVALIYVGFLIAARIHKRRQHAYHVQMQQLELSGQLVMTHNYADKKKKSASPHKDGEGHHLEEGGDRSSRFFSCNPENHRTFEIEYQDLGLVLPNGKEIMRNISGKLRVGRSCAIMGPSGSGKSTLLSLLTGKTDRSYGRVLINGREEDLTKYRRLIGFVPQEDIMLTELRVRDILLHSAMMRLPSDWPDERKKNFAFQVISFLGLDSVMDNIIGDNVHRGISGGQRKRVNIGMELVASPSILLLDEPTSGLDSSTALEVCTMLKKLAHVERLTVAAVIHSPSIPAFHQFDDLILLGKGGRLIFHGPISEAAEYFEALGFDIRPHENSADFYVDISQGRTPLRWGNSYSVMDLFKCWHYYSQGLNITLDPNSNDTPQGYESRPNRVAKRRSFVPNHPGVNRDIEADEQNHIHIQSFDFSPDFTSTSKTPNVTPSISSSGGSSQPSRSSGSPPKRRKVNAFLYVTYIHKLLFYIKSIIKDLKRSIQRGIAARRERATAGFFKSFWLCFKRAKLQMYKTSREFIVDQLLHLCIGMFISVAVENNEYLGLYPEKVCQLVPFSLAPVTPGCAYTIDNIKQSGMFISLGVLFAGITAAGNTFAGGNERVVYWRDTSNGMFVLPYYLAKWISDVPRMILGAIMFSTALILLFPYRGPLERLFVIILVMYFAAFGMGYFLSILVKRESLGTVTTGFVLLQCMVFGGVIVSPERFSSDGFLSLFKWILRISVPYHATNAFYKLEMEARPWQEWKSPTSVAVFQTSEGKVNIVTEGADYTTCIVYMVVLGVMWALLGLITMKLTHRSKQR